MTKRAPTAAEIATVETELWNVVRALNAIEGIAVRIGAKSNGEINGLAEGLAGIAAVAVSHVRRQQIALGGDE